MCILGDKILGTGCSAQLPIFFVQKSGLVTICSKETTSLLPEDIEDSLACSVAEPNDEVITNWNLEREEGKVLSGI